MDKDKGNNGKILNRDSEEDLRGRKSNRNNIIGVLVVFLIIASVSAVILGYLYFGETDYEKGMSFYKDKKFTEALYHFQKVEPGDVNFTNSQSAINYINGLLAFNKGNNSEANVLLAKVRSDDYYYSDAKLMMENFNEASMGNELQNTKDTVYIKKEITGTTTRKETEPVDPRLQKDIELSRKFISETGSSISRFESLYQTARTAPVGNKSDYSKSLESVNKEFNNIKYAADNKDAGVMELRRMTGDWMSKRIAFIRQLINDKTVNETGTSVSLKEEGDRMYSIMMNQMNKVKKNI